MDVYPGCVASVSACVRGQASVHRASTLFGQPQVRPNTSLLLQSSNSTNYIWVWYQKTHLFAIESVFFYREFRNLKPLRPTESSPTRLAVTKVCNLMWLFGILNFKFFIIGQFLYPNAFKSRPPSESSETLPGLIYFLQAASLGVAWTLAKGDKEKYWKLYRFNFPF